MRKILVLPLAFLLGFSSCKEDIEEYASPVIPERKQAVEKVEKDIAKKAAVTFFSSLIRSQEKSHSPSKISRVITKAANSMELTPITFNGETVYWVANNPENMGYTILSADKKQFPIAAYSHEGNFNYGKLNTTQKQEFDRMVSDAYLQMQTDQNKEDCMFWSDLCQENNENSKDTTTVVEVDFFANISETDNIAKSTIKKEGGSIPDRKDRKGYDNVLPLLWKDRQWTDHWPYNYDMPFVIVGDSSAPGSSSSGGIALLPNIVTGLALLMDYYEYPNPDFWKNQPNSIAQAQSTDLTKFLKQLTYDFGNQYNFTTTGITSKCVFTSIPQVLDSKYGYNTSEIVKYPADQTSFDNIRNSLYNRRPVLYQIGIINKGYNLLGATYIIDGVQEMYVTVTTTKRFLGFKVKRIVKHYYMDYFHYVDTFDRKYNCWGKYDLKKSFNKNYSDYVFLNFAPKK